MKDILTPTSQVYSKNMSMLLGSLKFLAFLDIANIHLLKVSKKTLENDVKYVQS